MRLWHKDLIAVLPRQQLIAQWRECCCIARNIAVNETPNHILVNKIMDYPEWHFYHYARFVFLEMRKHGYKCDFDKFDRHTAGAAVIHVNHYYVDKSEIFPEWHNKRYLKQCYYNLQEKYDCGGITIDEWSEIHKYYMGAII